MVFEELRVKGSAMLLVQLRDAASGLIRQHWDRQSF